MKRREFIAVLGGAATWPFAALGQQSEPMRRIGVLMAHPESDPEFQDYVSAFREALHNLGWTEGRNVRFDFRWGALDDAEVRQRSAKELGGAAPRPHCYAKYAADRGDAAADAHHPGHFRHCCRSGRQRLRQKPAEAGRQRHRLYDHGAYDCGQMGRVTEGIIAAGQARRALVQSGDDAVCGCLREAVQGRGNLRSGWTRRAQSFTTSQNSKPLLRRRHASQTAAWS